MTKSSTLTNIVLVILIAIPIMIAIDLVMMVASDKSIANYLIKSQTPTNKEQYEPTKTTPHCSPSRSKVLGGLTTRNVNLTYTPIVQRRPDHEPLFIPMFKTEHKRPPLFQQPQLFPQPLFDNPQNLGVNTITQPRHYRPTVFKILTGTR